MHSRNSISVPNSSVHRAERASYDTCISRNYARPRIRVESPRYTTSSLLLCSGRRLASVRPMSAFANAVYVLGLRECRRQNAYCRLAKVRTWFVVGNGIVVPLGVGCLGTSCLQAVHERPFAVRVPSVIRPFRLNFLLGLAVENRLLASVDFHEDVSERDVARQRDCHETQRRVEGYQVSGCVGRFIESAANHAC